MIPFLSAGIATKSPKGKERRKTKPKQRPEEARFEFMFYSGSRGFVANSLK
jgi:hypothetical protein